MHEAKNKIVFEHTVLEENAPQELMIEAEGLSLKNLKNTFRLLRADESSKKMGHATIEFSAVKISDDHYAIKPKKTLLSGPYEIYQCDDSDCKKIYQFNVKKSAPKLIFHTIGQENLPIVRSNRVYFKFGFDQPIFIEDKQNIMLKNSEGKLLEIIYANILSDRSEIEICIKESQLIAGERYYFELSRIRNSAHRERSLTQSFVVGRVEMPLYALEQARVFQASESIEWQWILNNAHETQALLYSDDKETNLIARQKYTSVMTKRRVIDEHRTQGVFRHLKASQSYYLVLLARDNQGQRLKKSLIIKTRESSGLAMSEVFVRPHHEGRQSESEFIEYYNYSDEDIRLSDIRVILSDSSHKMHECVVIAKDHSITVAKKSAFIIVGKGFKEENFSLPAYSPIIRLNERSICGGFGDATPKIIRLMRGEHEILDRYSGFLWPGVRGSSIEKRVIKGLDEESNYCYSKSVGPSPGVLRDPCL